MRAWRPSIVSTVLAEPPAAVPGRWSEVRQPTDVDLVEVGFIKMRIETASAKIRNAGPGDFQSVGVSSGAEGMSKIQADPPSARLVGYQ